MKLANTKKPRVELSSIRRIFPLASLLLISLSLLNPNRISAQDEEFTPPYYLVEEGDTLWGISTLLGIPLEELQSLNGISDPNQLMIGMQLLIPAPEVVSGRINTRTVAYGDTIRSLSRRFGLSEKTFAQLNRITSLEELIAGSSVMVPVENESQVTYQRISLAPGESLLELAVQSGENPWALMIDNNIEEVWTFLPGEVLQQPMQESLYVESLINGLPMAIKQVEITPFPPAQGNTLQINIEAPRGISLSGSFVGRELNFFPQENGYVALQGIHTLTEPGAYHLTLEGQLENGTNFAFSQSMLIRGTDYIFDPMLIVDPETVNPDITEPEEELWTSLGDPVMQEKMWDGLFASPVPSELTECWTSFFGNRRAYNGSSYDFFHSGLDFCGRVGTELFAPAIGKVVYTDSLIVRGGVVVIDHGWGVYSAYDHLSEILVQRGDIVQTGQTIGLGGETGRTTGPHLHWEVWVGGVQVDPADWLMQAYP